MNRTRIVAVIGACVAAVGSFLALRAGALATEWQRTESGNGWGGRMDPALQQTYQTVGLVVLIFGLVLVVVAAWNWMAAERRAADRPPGIG
jgi:hypothetical protein